LRAAVIIIIFQERASRRRPPIQRLTADIALALTRESLATACAEERHMPAKRRFQRADSGYLQAQRRSASPVCAAPEAQLSCCCRAKQRTPAEPMPLQPSLLIWMPLFHIFSRISPTRSPDFHADTDHAREATQTPARSTAGRRWQCVQRWHEAPDMPRAGRWCAKRQLQRRGKACAHAAAMILLYFICCLFSCFEFSISAMLPSSPSRHLQVEARHQQEAGEEAGKAMF